MPARVAVVMRTRNRPLLLRRAIASVGAQTYTDYTLVIVNDRGDAAPVEALIAEQPAELRARIRFVDNREDLGREGAMNVGIDAADSEFVVIHDDDDSWHPEFLERSVAYLDAHPDAGGVNARTEVVFERLEGDRVVEEGRDVLAADRHQVTLADVMQQNYVATIAFLYRRAAYLEVGPVDGSLPVLGDWEFNLRFLRRFPIGFLDGEPLAFWHQRTAATGDAGNSVVVAADEHRDYNAVIRDAYFRRSLDGGDRLGDFLVLSQLLDRMERSSAESRRLAAEQAAQTGRDQAYGVEVARTSIELAIGRLEERQGQLESQIRELADLGRPVMRFFRGVLAPAITAVRGARKVRDIAHRAAAPAPDGRPQGATVPSDAPRDGADPLSSPTTTTGAVETVAPRAVVTRDRVDTRVTGRPMKRVAFYLFFDPDGRVDDYVLYKLTKLREHVEHIFVVSNSPLDDEARERLESVADTVWVRENVGFDVWGYKEAQERFGWDNLADYDELILLNYTFFGPIFPFSELFDRMDAQDVDFWGLTEHAEVDPHPHHGTGVMPRHLQSHWYAVRREMFMSPEYRSYWTDMPMITSYFDSIDRHEARFLQHFNDLGFTSEVAFPLEDYPSMHPVFDDIVLMLQNRLPIIKRRIFFHDPLYLDRQAIIGRDAMDLIEASDYPSELIWSNVVRSSKPRVLGTNFSMMEILPDDEHGLDRSSLPRIVVVCHLYYDELVDEMLDHVETLPGEVDLVVTTTDAEKQRRIEEAVARRGRTGRNEVRVIPSNRGRDVSAFVVGCADVLQDERYDLVVKIHGKKSVQDGYNAGQWFKRHLLENLLPNPGYAANLVALFQQHPTLGMVFPPVIHMGYPTLGHAWFANKGPAKAFAKRFGITVPLDDSTPLSPFGSMFVARRDALLPLAEAGLTWEDFPAEGGYKDGTLAHVIERMFSYVAMGRGYHVRTVMNARLASVSHTFLEYKLQALSAFLPGYGIEQVPFLERQSGGVGPSPIAIAKHVVLQRSPRAAAALKPVYKGARAAYRRLRGR